MKYVAVIACWSILLMMAGVKVVAEHCSSSPGFDCTVALPDEAQAAGYVGPLSLARPNTAFSTQLHIHGSFSEGTGSMSAGGAEARNVGLDVIWWSDHDYGIFHQNHISTFGFEDWWEDEWHNEYWEPGSPAGWEKKKYWTFESADGIDSYNATISDAQAWEDNACMRMSATSALPDSAAFLYRFDSDRSMINQARTLAAEIQVEIAIFPEQIGADAGAEVLFALSDHGENTVRQLHLRYYLDNSPNAQPWRYGRDYNVPLSYIDNAWNPYLLHVTRDTVAGFPELLGEDNSANKMMLGVTSRAGATAAACFDSFHLHFNRWYPELYTKQRELLDHIETSEPYPVHLQGVELGGTEHLNMLSESVNVPNPSQSQSARVEQVHSEGGLIMLNHPFGFSGSGSGGIDPKLMVQELLSADVYGADLLEVGYRKRGGHTLPAHLEVWDTLAERHVYIVGVGTSDAHFWVPGNNAGKTNNFVSWIYADSPTKAALMDGLRRGRVYFGDLQQFNGRVELSTDQGFAMGQIVLTDRAIQQVKIDIAGLASQDEIVAVVNGEAVETFYASGSVFSQLLDIDVGLGACVRIEAYSQETNDSEKVFSNPLCFTRSLAMARPVEANRLGIDFAGFVSTLVDRFQVTDASGRGGDGSSILVIAGTGAGGVVVLDTNGNNSTIAVEMEGLTGRWSHEDGHLILWELQGTGTIRIAATAH